MNRQAEMAVAVTPRDPKNIDKVKVGDRQVITYTEAVAMKVEKVEKKKQGTPRVRRDRPPQVIVYPGGGDVGGEDGSSPRRSLAHGLKLED
jgi:hypothetical protein